MTPEAINIAIAESVGWSCDKDGNWRDKTGKYGVNGCPPRFNSDLNAMHEAEKLIKYSHQYMVNLAKICIVDSCRPAIFATAAQRAEAFLRTIGKWVEDKQ